MLLNGAGHRPIGHGVRWSWHGDVLAPEVIGLGDDATLPLPHEGSAVPRRAFGRGPSISTHKVSGNDALFVDLATALARASEVRRAVRVQRARHPLGRTRHAVAASGAREHDRWTCGCRAPAQRATRREWRRVVLRTAPSRGTRARGRSSRRCAKSDRPTAHGATGPHLAGSRAMEALAAGSSPGAMRRTRQLTRRAR